MQRPIFVQSSQLSRKTTLPNKFSLEGEATLVLIKKNLTAKEVIVKH